jgi:hypothetical protein
MKARPLMQVTSNAGWSRQPFAIQARLFFQMGTKTPSSPAGMFQPQTQNPVTYQGIELSQHPTRPARIPRLTTASRALPPTPVAHTLDNTPACSAISA